MPFLAAPAGMAIATAIAGTAAAGATAYGATKSAGASKTAARLTADADRRAQEIEQANELRRQQEYDRSEAEKKRQWDAEQAQIAEDRRLALEDRARKQQYEDEDRNLFYAKEARRAPYRAASDAALRSAAATLGLDVGAFPSRVETPYRVGAGMAATPSTRPASMASALTLPADTAPVDPYYADLTDVPPMRTAISEYRQKPRYA